MNQQVQAVTSQCPSSLAEALLPFLTDGSFAASFSPAEIQILQQRSGLTSQALAVALLPLAASYALTPLSGFKVGAIAQGASGRWYLGANMEFAGSALQQTVHAEQSAITHAWMKDESSLTAITVNYTPCGHCRQFMNELNSGAQLVINLPECSPQTLNYYLPNAFGPKDLGITRCLFDPQHRHFLPHPEPLAQAAILAASQSYAPYSEAYSGVAIRTRQGRIVSGRYAENAAYNPTLPPLQAALIMLNLMGYTAADIAEVTLAEFDSAKVSQYPATHATLAAICDKPLSLVTISTES